MNNARRTLHTIEDRFLALVATAGAKVVRGFGTFGIWTLRVDENALGQLKQFIFFKIGIRSTQLSYLCFQFVSSLLDRRIHLRKFNLIHLDRQCIGPSGEKFARDFQQRLLQYRVIPALEGACDELASAIKSADKARSQCNRVHNNSSENGKS